MERNLPVPVENTVPFDIRKLGKILVEWKLPLCHLQVSVARPLLGNLALDVEPPGCSCRVRIARRLLRENSGDITEKNVVRNRYSG